MELVFYDIFDGRIDMRYDECASGFVACIQIDRSEKRLEGVGENDEIILPAAYDLAARHLQMLRHVETLRDRSQVRATHESAANVRELSLGSLGIAQKKRLGDDELQYCVTQKLETLIMLGKPVWMLIDR